MKTFLLFLLVLYLLVTTAGIGIYATRRHKRAPWGRVGVVSDVVGGLDPGDDREA
jgi:hypothetical protein